jgi:hypothetical protein
MISTRCPGRCGSGCVLQQFLLSLLLRPTTSLSLQTYHHLLLRPPPSLQQVLQPLRIIAVVYLSPQTHHHLLQWWSPPSLQQVLPGRIILLL